MQQPVAQLHRLPRGYAELLEELKARIRATQLKASLSVNRELVGLYWQIGERIVERQQRAGWGKSVIERLARDLQAAFPGIQGFSASNLSRMRAFYLAYADQSLNSAQAVPKLAARNSAQAVPKLAARKSAQLVPKKIVSGPPAHVTEIPWGHNIVLLFRLADPGPRLWYARKTIEHGWSRAVLVHQIESDLHGRQGKAASNFVRTLPAPQSDLAHQLLKDPYHFDFLTLSDEARERDLERGLIDHIQKFLLELGVGFAFVGRQYPLEIAGKNYYLDLLFYHLQLRCFVIVDLKVEEFEPEQAGKMNFYLSVVDDRLRHADDRPSIGLILCRQKNRLIVEYALRDTHKPIGVAGYTVGAEPLPPELQDRLPSVKRIEAVLEDVEGVVPRRRGKVERVWGARRK